MHEDINYDDLEGNFSNDGKNFRTYCPFCHHHKKNLAILVETGQFQCFVCGETGGRVKLAQALSSTLNSAQQDLNKNQQLQPAHSYLSLRSITSSTHNIQTDGTYLHIPYINYKTGKVQATKYKALNPTNPYKYKLEGKTTGYYIPSIESFNSADDLIIVEGEIDALSVLELSPDSKITSLATLGINSLSGTVDLLSTIPKTFKTIYIWFDNDSDDLVKSKVRDAVDKLITALKAGLNRPEIRLISPPQHIKDPNEYLMSGYGPEHLTELLRASQRPPLPKIVKPAHIYFEPLLKFLKDKDRKMGHTTLIDGIDKALGGGKRLGEITVTHAEAKTGKNSLWHSMMFMWLEAQIPVGYASRELSPESEVLPHLLSIWKKEPIVKMDLSQSLEEFDRISSLNSDGPRPNSLNLLENSAEENSAEENLPTILKEFRQKLQDWPLYFADGYGVIEFEDLSTWMLALIEEGVKYFWIDHLHHCLIESEDYKQVAKLCMQLKAFALKHQIHIDLIIQPKLTTPDQKLSKSTLRGGSVLGQVVDNIFILEREAQIPNVSKLTLDTARSHLAKEGTITYLEYLPQSQKVVETTIVKEFTNQNVDSADNFNIDNKKL